MKWIVKDSKFFFVGKDAFIKQKEKGVKKTLIAFEMIDKCIPRKGYKIYSAKEIIGEVTSGTFSLGLKIGIGMGYINQTYLKTKNKNLFIEVRGKKNKGKIIKAPFIKNYSLYD